jgi:hypothetical protein
MALERYVGSADFFDRCNRQMYCALIMVFIEHLYSSSGYDRLSGSYWMVSILLLDQLVENVLSMIVT